MASEWTINVTEAIAPRLQGAQLVVGGKQSLKQMRATASQATQQLDVDLFSGAHPKTLEKLAKVGSAVDSLFLADPEVSWLIRSELQDAGNTVVDVGSSPLLKNHAKSVVADGQHAFVTTAAITKGTPKRFEVGATFSGDAGKAMSELTRASATGDADAIRAAADEAQRFGIVVNDAQYGIWKLSEEVRGLISTAEHRLIVSTKRLEEPGILDLIKDAKARGVEVTHSKLSGKGLKVHSNVVVADNAAYLGSGHLSKRVITGGGSNGRVSRELGLVIEDRRVVDELVQALADHKLIAQELAPGHAASVASHVDSVAPVAAAARSGMPTAGKMGILAAGVAAAGTGAYLLRDALGD